MAEGSNGKSIAGCGKGGVGRAALTALAIGILRSGSGLRLLAIDGDPVTGSCNALGVSVKRTMSST